MTTGSRFRVFCDGVEPKLVSMLTNDEKLVPESLNRKLCTTNVLLSGITSILPLKGPVMDLCFAKVPDTPVLVARGTSVNSILLVYPIICSL